MSEIRTLVVDDEPRARKRITELLTERVHFELVGECESGREAALAVAELRPDLVFLDVELPEADGFDVIKSSSQDHQPAVVFVTAHEGYALNAFDAQAVDFLLKPFTDERFDRALSRVEENLRNHRSGRLQVQISQLLKDFDIDRSEPLGRTSSSRPAKRHMDRILLRTDEHTFFMKVSEIDWIEAADYYAKFHVGEDIHMVRVSLNSLEEKLDPDQFIRIHRSTIVNLERVEELQRWVNGAYLVTLRDGTKLRLSRGRRENLEDLLGRSL